MSGATRLALLLVLGSGACGDPAPPPGTPPPGGPPPAAATAAPVVTPVATPVATPEAADGGVAAGKPGEAKDAKAAPPKVNPCLSLAGRERILCETRNRPFKTEDLSASPPHNADPFHNNLADFATKKTLAPTNVTGPPLPPCILEKYGLEDLKLAAIIVSPTDATLSRAMFIDPATVGQTVKRGDCVGKLRARVQRISPDKVLFEFTEDLGGGKVKQSTRSIDLHPAEVGSR